MNLAELKKNSWIYSSKISLIGVALVYLLSLALVHSLKNETDNFFGSIDGEANFSKTVYFISLAFFVVFTSIWGMFAVSGAVISELRNRTWVYQKMSAIKAIDMCVGKLFGPSLYQWLLGIVFLLVSTVLALGFEEGRMESLITVFNLFLITLILHCSALVLSLLSIRRNEYSTDTGNIRSAPMIIIMTIVLVQAMRTLALEEPVEFTWYGMQINAIFFNLFSLIAFMFWSMIAYYRNMRAELQYQNRPFYWVGFNVFLLLFYGGLVFEGDYEGGAEFFNAYFAVSFVALLVASLLALFLEPINVISYSTLLHKIKAKHWSKVFDVAPLWMISAVFSFFVCLLLCTSLFNLHGAASVDKIDLFFLIPLVAFLFLVKSLLVNLYLHLAQVKKANFIWFLYMTLWYGMIPALLGMKESLFLFYPTDVMISGLAVLVYIGILVFLIQRSIKKAEVF